MLVNTLSVLGLAACAAAAPHAAPVPNLAEAKERGMIWAPRGLHARDFRNNFNFNQFNSFDSSLFDFQETEVEETVILTEEDVSDFSQSQDFEQEEQLAELVSGVYNSQVGWRSLVNNARFNHYRNRNSDNVAIILVVYTQVVNQLVDGGSNRIGRAAFNLNDQSQEFASSALVMIQDFATMTINSDSSNVLNSFPSGSTGFSTPSVGQFSSSNFYNLNNNFELMPDSFQSFQDVENLGVKFGSDPGLITQSNVQDLFIESTEVDFQQQEFEFSIEKL